MSRGQRVAQDGEDLTVLLKSFNARIEALERRPDGRPNGGEDILRWTPDITAVTTAPAGTRTTRNGLYWLTEINNPDWVLCGGIATVRIGAGIDRGSGYYLLNVPLSPVQPPIGEGEVMDEWYIMGTVSCGFSDGIGTHRSAFALTRNGFAIGTGGEADGASKAAVISSDSDILFVGSAAPKAGVDMENIHWRFSYPVPRP